MSLLRLIARLDLKGGNVVKGVQMEGLRVIGKPADLARCYAAEADELLYIDTVASLYGRNQLTALLEETCEDVFIPVTVAGGIASREDVKRLLNAGADKVAINTAAIKTPGLIADCAGFYGSQAVVVSIEAKRVNGGWEAYTENGRQRTGKDAVAWAREAVRLGAGELLLTSVDRDGTRRGFDLALIEAVGRDCPVPLTVCGGMGGRADARSALAAGADALAFASVLHYGKMTIQEVREGLTRAAV